MKRLLVTGGCGFIGSHFLRLVLAERDWEVVNLDALRYSGNPANVADLAQDSRYSFIHGDICRREDVCRAMDGCFACVNFAAETHVDRSILEPGQFVQTDVLGVHTLLEAGRSNSLTRFVHISTDEVYGSVEMGESREEDQLKPRSPYSASKAGGELLAMSYYHTFGSPVIVTRGSNTYGPNQYPEKLIPLFTTNALDDQPLPLYGDGLNERDWLYVEDHCRAILHVLEYGKVGNVYNIGAGCPKTNIEITRAILALLGKPESLIQPVADRPGHDRRYALNCEKIRKLGWTPQVPFSDGFAKTVRWYADNRSWWEPIKSGEFRAYYQQLYAHH
jgi:dTDP-glucose 4,6-dehydratase